MLFELAGFSKRAQLRYVCQLSSEWKSSRSVNFTSNCFLCFWGRFLCSLGLVWFFEKRSIQNWDRRLSFHHVIAEVLCPVQNAISAWSAEMSRWREWLCNQLLTKTCPNWTTLVGGWTTHLKNMLVTMDHFPKYGWKFKKYLSCHHLEK